MIWKDDQVCGIWDGDRSLISAFFLLGYHGKELEALNKVRRYRNLIHVSDIVKCDGQSLDEFIILDLSELSCAHTFPREQPTATDFCLWNEAFGKLCSGTTSLPHTLGHFLRKPHLPWSWYTTTEADHLYRYAQTIPPLYDTYRRQRGCIGTRYGKKHDWIETAIRAHPGVFYASVTMRDAICAVLHSTSRVPEIVTAPTFFLKTLQMFGNSSL